MNFAIPAAHVTFASVFAELLFPPTPGNFVPRLATHIVIFLGILQFLNGQMRPQRVTDQVAEMGNHTLKLQRIAGRMASANNVSYTNRL